MNLTQKVDILKYSPYIFNDNDYGGTSTSTISIVENTIHFECQTKPSELTFPFCSVIIPLVPDSDSMAIDLSSYNKMHLKLAFDSAMNDTVLVYLQNDETGIDNNTLTRANISILAPENEVTEYDLMLEEFHLPSWWVYDHLDRTDNFEPDFSSVKRIQIATGDNRLPRRVAMTIHSIEFSGKWLNDTQIYTFIISTWFAYFAILIGFKIYQLNRRSKKAYYRAQKLASLNESLEQSATAKGMFLANMSHEIRTPMNGIYGTLQLLKQNKLSEENDELIDKALLSTKSLLTIINDILDFSKIEAGKLELEETSFDLKSTLKSIASDFDKQAAQKGIVLKTTYPKELGKYWIGDPVRIKQILLNLTSNAIKFTSSGRVSIAILPSNDLEQRIHHTLKIIVKDTGIGMSSEALTRLFDRFEQADNTTTRKYGGTGLGMSITNSLIAMMGGEINVTSKPDRGTKFTIWLPLKPSDKASQLESSDPDISRPHLPGKKVLIVEDNNVNLLLLKKMIEKTEATIFEALDGNLAIEQTIKCHPDIILMDIQMPNLDGKDACQRIRELDYDVPIIAFTANVLQHEVEEYLSTGFDGFLAKPVELKKLYEILNTHL